MKKGSKLTNWCGMYSLIWSTVFWFIIYLFYRSSVQWLKKRLSLKLATPRRQIIYYAIAILIGWTLFATQIERLVFQAPAIELLPATYTRTYPDYHRPSIYDSAKFKECKDRRSYVDTEEINACRDSIATEEDYKLQEKYDRQYLDIVETHLKWTFVLYLINSGLILIGSLILIIAYNRPVSQ